MLLGLLRITVSQERLARSRARRDSLWKTAEWSSVKFLVMPEPEVVRTAQEQLELVERQQLAEEQQDADRWFDLTTANLGIKRGLSEGAPLFRFRRSVASRQF